MKHWFLLLAACGLANAALAADEAAYKADVSARVVFQSGQSAMGQPLLYEASDKPQATMLQVTIPPGKETGWHKHPVQGYGYILSGQLTVSTRDGRENTFKAGQGFAEVVNLEHNGRNTGTEPVVLVVVFTGNVGQPFVIKAQ